MRFLFYDRVVELEKMKTIVGIKTFALSEEFHRGHFRKVALIPGVILIETMAQLLGWLINYSYDFKLYTLMSLIEKVELSTNLRPGMESRIYGEILSTSGKDTLGKAWIDVGGETIASMERIIYNHFQQSDPEELKARFGYFSGLTNL
jgi:3-hydroxyacyl-[acyl-carrier-protein] dehydratase